MNAKMTLDFRDVIWDKLAHPGEPTVILGAYRRASTRGQREGWRFQEAFGELIELALRLGPEYGVMLFDEGVCSGVSIAARRQFPVLLDFLRAGLIYGIVTTDVKRLTRDQTLTDGIEIARLLQARSGLLVTRGRVWNLREQCDFREYCAELVASANEISVIRDLMYEGQEKRAQAVIRGEAPPMFKGPPGVGYKRALCFRSREQSRPWVVDPPPGSEPIVHRGVVIRTWTRCPQCGPHVEVLHEELLHNGTLGEVARAMNERGVPAPWKLRDGTRYWNAKLIHQILRNPIYWGRWRWVYARRAYETDVPELAYWPQDDAAEFAERFLAVERKHRVTVEHRHLATGLVACATCHCLLREAGRDYTVRQDGRVYSPLRMRCPECRKHHSEDGLLRALDDFFPEAFAQLGDVGARLEHLNADGNEGVRIDAIDRRLRVLHTALAARPGVSQQLDSEIKRLSTQLRELERRRVSGQAALDWRRIAELRHSLKADPHGTYQSLTPSEKSAFWRAILQDENGNVTPVEMVRVKKGNSQRSPGRWAVVRSPFRGFP